MKFLPPVIILLSFLLPQSSTSSMIGFGARISNMDPSTAGLGLGSFFSSHSDNFTISSPSSLWKTTTARLSISSSFNKNNNQNVISGYQFIDQFSFVFPIRTTGALSFGIKPGTRTEFNIRTDAHEAEHIQYLDDVFAPAYYYSGSGGISKFFISGSRKLNENYSIGISWEKEFGNIFLADSVLSYKVTTNPETGDANFTLSDISYQIRTNNFNGSSMYFEGAYYSPEEKYSMMVGIKFHNAIRLKTTSTSPVTGSETRTSKTIGAKISDLNAGFKYTMNETVSAVLEMNYNRPLQSDAAAFGINENRQISIHTGVLKRVKNPKLGMWNSLNLSYGLFSSQHNLSIGNYTDTGMTFGVGLEYFSFRNNIDLVITTGKRTSPFQEFDSEKYINLMIGISTGETWFIKRRRK